MWVLDQEKELLINTDKIISFNIYNSQILAVYDSETEDDYGHYIIGEYSEERVQEIFNQLLEALTNPVFSSFGTKFEMPEE